jgi:hypothetical protein
MWEEVCVILLFLVPSLPVCIVTWILGRKRVHWNLFDFLVLVLPYAAWWTLDATIHRPKSLANLGELLYLGLAVALFPTIRLVVARRLNEKLVATILLTVACLVAAGIYLLVPCLPE